MFTDSAVCYSFAPPKQPGEAFGIWDELRMGTEARLGWLGRPRGPAIRLARKARDLLGGGKTGPAALAGRISGEGVRVEVQDEAIRISTSVPGTISNRKGSRHRFPH